jgi:hypothetical protein
MTLGEIVASRKEEAAKKHEASLESWSMKRDVAPVTDVDLSNIMKKVHPAYSLSHDAIM